MSVLASPQFSGVRLLLAAVVFAIAVGLTAYLAGVVP